MRTKTHATALAAILLALAAGCAPKEEAAEPAAPKQAAAPATPAPALEAHAALSPRDGGSESGWITFTETGGVVSIAAHVEGVARTGRHGFHIHEIGDCSAADFTSAGGHWNPDSVPHAGPDDAERHAGDLGNVEVGGDGSGHVERTSDLFTVADGPRTVVGRAVILHEGEDDLVSQPTGAAGARLACGVVVEGPPEAHEGDGSYEEGSYDEGDAS